MRILLTNDDGYGALGLEVLAESLSQIAEIYIIAPSQERSGTSQAITVRDPMEIQWHSSHRIALGGYPADCVNVGIAGKWFPDFDLVISGINHGPNLGTDVIFSGTVAGARQAMIHGISGIAVSMNRRDRHRESFVTGASYILKLVKILMENKIDSPYLFNVNIPAATDRIQGFQWTTLGNRVYVDDYRVLSHDAASALPREIILHGDITSTPAPGNVDFSALDKDFISVTPLLLDQTDRAFSVSPSFTAFFN